MDKKQLLKIVIQKCLLYYSLLGLVIGVGLFFYSFFNENLTFQAGQNEIRGIKSGLIAIPFTPLVMSIVGLAHGIMMWFPIIYFLKKVLRK
ncbi:hypothetical protein J2R98_002162 [Alkalibacillus filiformis]|uniref:Uncharacterized protein n=1 Tax=Alkalibacillus filiformis TaxID=200990 RepID=A0ABU0DVJ3_9BACI|nr:hypothetical protein [Alkalibacillus filiformis]MDQ0352318.1 hypothetical protein [Alkalibacillus filiformis]